MTVKTFGFSVAVVLAVAATAFAQHQGGHGAGQQHGQDHAQHRTDRARHGQDHFSDAHVSHLAKELGLNQNQTRRVAAVAKEAAQQSRRVNASDLAPARKKARLEQVHAQAQAKIMEILGAGQRAKFRQMHDAKNGKAHGSTDKKHGQDHQGHGHHDGKAHGG